MTRLPLILALLAGPAFAQQGQPGSHFIENWDLDGDGAVTVAEATERRGNVFLSFDANEDGYLDAEEYVLFDEARENDMADNGGQQGHGQGAMRNAAGGMRLEMNDTDGDGKVSREEFLANADSWIMGMDRDGDGKVTTADFGPGKGMGQGKGQGNGNN